MGRKRSLVEVKCQFCGTPFEVAPSRLKFGRGRHCSRSCQYSAARVDASPSPSPSASPRPDRVPRVRIMVEIACSLCGAKVMRRPCQLKGKHGSAFCSRACHYKGRSAGLSGRVVVKPYTMTTEGRASQSAKAAREYAAGRGFPIPETETRTSAALGAAGIPHVHQHVIDLGDRSVAVDLFFPDRMLVIELDEPSLHSKPRFAAVDAKRDADLVAAGYTVRRVLDDRNVQAILARVLQALV